MRPNIPPPGYSVQPPTTDDAEAVSALIAVCQLAIGDRSGMNVEKLVGDWEELDLSEDTPALVFLRANLLPEVDSAIIVGTQSPQSGSMTTWSA